MEASNQLAKFSENSLLTIKTMISLTWLRRKGQNRSDKGEEGCELENSLHGGCRLWIV